MRHMAIVTIVLLFALYSFGASPRAVEVYSLTMQLMGGSPAYPQYAVYPDFYVNAPLNSAGACHFGGEACGYAVFVSDMNGDTVLASGLNINISNPTASTIPGVPGRNLWGDVVDVGRAPRKATTSIKTRNGGAYVGLFIGAYQTASAVSLCSSSSAISTKVTAKVKLLGRSDVFSPTIGATYYGGICDPERATCLCRASGESYVTGESACSATASIVMTPLGLGVYEVMEDIPEILTELDPNRLPPQAQMWPGAGWQRLEMDGTWTSMPQMYRLVIMCKDPNESMADMLSGTEAWVYCEVINSNCARLSRIMQGVSVGMNKCPDGYMSDYLFFSSDPDNIGRYKDKWDNPCHVLYLTDGQTIDPLLPDANMPDVIGRWLLNGTPSDLNADGIVSGIDYAISAENP